MIILLMAGGLSKRFITDENKIPKVVYPINNKPMIIHIIEQIIKLKNIEKIILIVNNLYYEEIKKCVDTYINNENLFHYIFQNNVNGTGGAIQCTLNYIEKFKDTNALIISGDTPYIKSETIQNLLNKNNSLLITELEDPKHNGRIIIKNNSIKEIVEYKDCDDEQKLIKYVNCGIYNFEINNLLRFIPLLNNNNKSKEYYLTDIIKMISDNNIDINYFVLEKEKQIEIYNINTPEDLLDSIKKISF
jgi:bifunctional N-acetylglucosamine-1-phosphate-uridyltransferase/glucosamine-1-phosphate-acetyltransferase GlmU-like protein